MASPPSSERPSVLRLRDPLSEVSRKERRALLGTSLLGVALTHTGLLPSEITALGVKLSAGDQQNVLYLLATMCAYLLLAFVAYAASDYIAWRLALQDALRSRLRESREQGNDEYEQMMRTEVERMLDDVDPSHQRVTKFVFPVSRLRALLEFALPVVFACYAIVALVRGAA